MKKKRVRVVVQTKIVIRRLRKCYKNIQMKADDITKLTAELKSDNLHYRNKIYHFVGCFRGHSNWKHCHIYTVKIIYRMIIIGRRQVIVRFMNYKNFAKLLKIIQGHWQWHYSIDRIQVFIRLHWHYGRSLYRFRNKATYWPKKRQFFVPPVPFNLYDHLEPI